MPRLEIPRETWPERLSEFTAIHQGWLVSLDVPSGAGFQTEIDNLPLLGISVGRLDRDGVIAVAVARSDREHVTHMIEGVQRIYIQKTDEGADAALTLESADGTKTRLRFRVSALPETVDGIVEQ